MNSFVLLLLIGGCLATPIQQGGIRIVQYTAGKEGINTQNDGSPVPQPIIWNQEQPIIVEPAPLTYGAVKGGALLTERDQQRHINVDDEVEGREEVSVEETRPDSESNLDSRDVIRIDNQRPVQTETAALLGSSILPQNGGGVKQIVTLDNEQVFPQVVSGQRRLIETQQPQQYSVKGKTLTTISGASPSVDIGYQPLHYGIPISIEEHRVTSQGVKRPVVQYQLQPVQQEVTREVVRRPAYQVVQQSVKGGSVPRQVHYVIQPILPSSVNVVSRQQQQQQQAQSLNRAQAIQLGQLGQVGQLGQLGQSEGKLQIENLVRQPQDETQGVINRDIDLRPINLGQVQVGEGQRDDLIQRHGVKTLVQQTNQRTRDETVRHVPVISGQRVVGYQLVSTQNQQPQQQQVVVPSVDQSLVSNQQIVYTQTGQQYVPYVIQQQIPQTDYQQYYQLVNHQVQTQGQQDDQQFNPYVVQPVQYSDSSLLRVEQPLRTVSQSQANQGNHGVQGVQQIQNERVVINRGQDLRVNPLSISQRTTGVTGVKGVVNV